MYTYAYFHVYTFIHNHTSNPHALPFVAFIHIKAMCWDISTYEHTHTHTHAHTHTHIHIGT